jgi:hypothetical protein
MAKKNLKMPPFPRLEWDKSFWSGEVLLPSWAGFQSRRGAYATVTSGAKSDGRARLTIDPEDEEARTPPLPEQRQAYQLLLDTESNVGNSILEAIFAKYPGMRKSYGYDDDEAAELMPEIERPKQLRKLIGLSEVHVLNVAKVGIAYIGFEFGCTWDSEHGLGVMTHRDRVIKVGGADTSFLAWIAEEDATANGE